MSDPKKNPPANEPDRAQMMRILVPAVAIIVVIVLVAVVASLTSGSGRKMSDGSDGTAEDSGLKEATPGVKIRDLKEGTGEACPAGAKVKVHYTGWLTDGTVFDSSKEANRGPTEFPLTTDPVTRAGVIVGWQEGIPGMKVGGIRKIVISPEKAYGKAGRPPKIPGDSTLIFEVELLEFSPPPRPRRTPAPTDLTKLIDDTAPTADDPGLKPVAGSPGLMYRDVKEGDGPVVPAGAKVLVDYIGWRRSDGKMFDSSWKPGGKSFEASLSGGVIPGWMKGIPGMKVGGVRKLVIPPELAYGSTGAGDDIPPNATLVFQVELLGIQ